MSSPQPLTPPPNEGKVLGWLSAVKGLTLTNALVIILLLIAVVPAYVVYKALGDDKLMDRLMSTYEDLGSHSGCTLRHVQERGGPDLWTISSGFAFQGNERWHVAVILDHEPGDEMEAFCISLKLISDRMLSRGNGGSDLHSGSVPGTPADGSGRDRPVPADPAPETTE